MINNQNRTRPIRDRGPRTNNQIRVPEVRVLQDDIQLGVMPTYQALKLAEEAGVDLVEIAPQAKPPVCRIVDRGRYLFEEAKAKKPTKTNETKEIKLRPKTDTHDLEHKIKNARQFLSDGDRVKIVVVFKGREMAHPEVGRAILDRATALLIDIGTIQSDPVMDGRQMTCLIAPK
jgi:translation initiation factor IF-3